MNFCRWSLARNWSGLHHLHLFLSQFRCRIGVQIRKHHDSVHRRCSSHALAQHLAGGVKFSAKIAWGANHDPLGTDQIGLWHWHEQISHQRRWDITQNTVERRRDECPGYMDMWHFESDISMCQGAIICVLRNVIDLFLKMISKMKA